jgi:hypothetical protein
MLLSLIYWYDILFEFVNWRAKCLSCFLVSKCLVLNFSDSRWSYCCRGFQSCGNIWRVARCWWKAWSCTCHMWCWCHICWLASIFLFITILKFGFGALYVTRFLSGSFTTNVVAAAPVLYCKSTLDISNTVREFYVPCFFVKIGPGFYLIHCLICLLIN